MAKFGIGQAVTRVEDQRFLTGRGRYVEDISLPHQAYGVAVLSPHAHARIRAVDTSRAEAAPGVLFVLTGADAEADHLGKMTGHPMPEDVGAPKGYKTFFPVLVSDRVRFVGERVAYVVAETLGQARDAAELVEVDYDVLPSVVDLEDAVKPGAPKIWDDCENGNVGFRLMFGSKDKADAAFAGADHVVKLRVFNNRVAPSAIEPRCAIGDYSAADDQFTLYTTSQNPHGTRQELSHIFHIPENRLRVVAPDVGGGFGLKGATFADEALVLWASRRAGRPVKWVATRSESMMTDHHARETVTYAELAVSKDGRILGLREHSLFQTGAYYVGPVLASAGHLLRLAPEAYDVQAMHVSLQGVFTNTVQTCPYRGAGMPEATYIMERLMDEAARVLGIGQADIRRRNLIAPEKLPYATPTFYNYDSGDFPRVMQRCLDTADWAGFSARADLSRRRGRLRGRSVVYYIGQSGIFNERMDLRFDPSGSLTIVAGTHSHGQGHATVFAQLVHEWLGVPFDQIRYIQGDTAQVPMGRGTYAARSSMLGSNALRVAADGIIEKGRQMAAALMEASETDIEFAEGSFRVVGTDKAMPLVNIARAFYAPAGHTDRLGVGLEAAGTYGTNPPNFPNGAHVCEVEVDPETGEVAVDRYFVIDDVGVAMNPLIVRGQIHGGIAQGLGQALVENAWYDRTSGQLLAGSFTDYAMPRADLMPDMVTDLEQIPCATNPLGIKSIGESGVMGAPPVVINAIIDALRPLGVNDIEMPATPARVWQTIRRAAA